MTIKRETYTPHTAGQAVGVHANTIRTWALTYAPLLSAGAQQKPYQFTPADVAMFQAIKEMRSVDIEPTVIIQRLSQVPASDLQQPYIEPPPQDAPGDAQGTNVLSDTAIATQRPTSTAVQAIIDLAGARLDAIDERVGNLERQRSIVVAAAIGALVGAGLVAVGFWLAMMAR